MIRKRLVHAHSTRILAFWLSLAQLPGYLIWGTFAGWGRIAPEYWLPASISVVLNLAANLLFLEAVRRGPLSVTIPVLSFTPVFVAVFSGPLLGEYLNGGQWCGVFVVTAGALFLTAPRGVRKNPIALVLAFIRAPGVLQMLGVALLWAATPLFDKMALRAASVPIHGGTLALTGAAGMLLFLVVKKELHALPLSWFSSRWILGGGFANVAALGLQLVSISVMVVSEFESFKRAAGVLLSLLLGASIFGEKISRAHAFAAFTIAVGVIAVLNPI